LLLKFDPFGRSSDGSLLFCGSYVFIKSEHRSGKESRLHMEKHWQGLDFLRGLGIFFLLVFHSAFYYFGGLWDLDLDNPPLIITIIGFLLMFAGMFAMISGAAHGIGILRLYRRDRWSLKKILRKKAVSAAFMLIIAYLYFLLTGPGLAVFDQRRMDNSLLVELIRSGRLAGISLERFFYVDSLVMIGSNILLVSLIWIWLLKTGRLRPGVLLGLAGTVMALTLLRLPLYPYYREQFAAGNWFPVLTLFWLVNKNNPVMPFLAFGLLGSWLGLCLEEGRSRRPALILGIVLAATGLTLYVFLPDTMLQREIDLKWYSIMLTQLGLFLLLILGSLALFDRKAREQTAAAPTGWLCRFLCRFSYAGLTAFFWESVLAALAWRLLLRIFPGLQFDIAGALLFGFSLALLWGFLLLLWAKWHFAGSIEYFYGLVVGKLGRFSSKSSKLKSGS